MLVFVVNVPRLGVEDRQVAVRVREEAEACAREAEQEPHNDRHDAVPVIFNSCAPDPERHAEGAAGQRYEERAQAVALVVEGQRLYIYTHIQIYKHTHKIIHKRMI